MNGRILSFIFWVGMYIEGYALEEGAGPRGHNMKNIWRWGLKQTKKFRLFKIGKKKNQKKQAILILPPQKKLLSVLVLSVYVIPEYNLR